MVYMAAAQATLSRPPGVQPSSQRPRRQRRMTINGVTGCAKAPSALGPHEPQLWFAAGASVYDRSQHGNCRGYGIIDRAAEPAPDGTQKWFVRWDGAAEGSRCTAISERYLELSHIHHRHRKEPTGLQQPILVMVGSSKGKTGVTEKKSGWLWTCQLDGETGRQSFQADQLHATGEPAPTATLTPFEPKVLHAALPVGEISDFISNLQLDPEAPVDLRRIHPENGTVLELMTGALLPSDLDDDMLRRLRYKATGNITQLTSSEGPLSEEERRSLVGGLQRTTQGAWTIKLVCARAHECGCPYALQFQHNLDGTATVMQTEAHQFHDPSSAEDLAKLSMHPTLQSLGWVLLECGVSPMMVQFRLNQRAQRDGLLGSSSSSLQASNARGSIMLQQVYALQKQVRRARGYGITTDAAAIEAIAAQYRQQGVMPFYQPYRAGTNGSAAQPLVLVLQTPFQARMLAAFGRALVFCDATYGVTKWGYPLYGVAVQDDIGRGVPVGWMVTSSDQAEVLEAFFRALQEGARRAGAADFKYGWFMIDKSLTEIAAVRLLRLTGDAKGHLLCYFHFLQEWERFLVSKESGVGSPEEKNGVMVALAELADCGSEAVFKAQLQQFYATYRRWPKVVAKMRKDWAPCAADWARWGEGRQDSEVKGMGSDTTNPIERSWGLIKYGDLQRKAQNTVHQLLDALLTVTVPRCMQQRALQLVGRASSDQLQREQRIEVWVQRLVGEGAVAAVAAGSDLGQATVEGESSTVVYLGDLSCSCAYSAEHLCVHLKAAARHIGFTHRQRLAAAAHLAANGSIEVGEAGICTCPALADISRKQTFRPEEGFCTCYDRSITGTCCHLLAAAVLPAFANTAVLLGAPQPLESEMDKRIEIHSRRTFQQARSEPLGEDWQAEVSRLWAAKAAVGAAVQQAQTNADPAVAQLRSDAAYVQRTVAALPEGEARQALLDKSAELRGEAEAAAAAASLRPTEVRAGKQQRRRNLRSPDDRVVKALLARSKGDSATLRQRRVQQQQVALEDRCDELPKLAKRGKQVKKMRGVTVPGNTDGTLLRNGASHSRMPKKQKRQ